MAVTLPMAVIAADAEIKPEIEASTYGFWLRDEETGGGLDKGLAALISPSVAVNITGKHLSSALFYQHQSVWYDDSQRSHKSLDNYSWDNTLTGYDGRVKFGLTTDSTYRVRDSRQGVFSDIITSSDKLSKTRSHGATLDFSSGRSSDYSARLGFAYSELKSEAPQQSDGFGDFENQFSRVNLALGSAERHSTAFWQLTGNYNETTREAADDFASRGADAVVGLPLHANLSLIGRGSHQQADNLARFAIEFSSYGVGLEYQFGRVSRINVTKNRSERTISSPDLVEIVKEDYVGTEIYLAPTRRTLLQYTLEHQYYGRSATLTGQYNLRFLSVQLSASDRVETQSFFQQFTEDLGVFVCPNGGADFSDCFKPTTYYYELATGESYQQWFRNDVELNDEIVQRRSAALNIDYSKNRLGLNIQYSESEDEFLESDRFNKMKTWAVQSTWKLSEQSNLLLNASKYEINYVSEQRDDHNVSVEFGVKTQLNDHSDVSASVRRISRNSSINSFDIKESRLWLTYSYRL